MSLTITPGTLRSEGPGFIPRTHFRDFVQGTDIVNFGPENFERDTNNAIHFIFSATDPPATNSRSRSLLWYNRGDGRMYVWDNAWNGTNDSLSIGHWCAVSDRKDIVVRFYDGDTASWDNEGWLMPYMVAALQNFASCDSNSVTQHGGQQRFVPNAFRGQMRWTKYFIHQSNYSAAPDSETILPMTELGFCWAGIHTNSSGPGFGWMIDSSATVTTRDLLHNYDPNSGDGPRWWPYRAHAQAYMLGLIVGSGPASSYSAAENVSRMQFFLRPEVARLHLS